MECRVCHTEYPATQHDIQKRDFMCLECKRKYQAEWRSKRIAAGLPAYGSKTWDAEKKKAYLEQRKNDPVIKKYNADRMREYAKNPEVRRRNMARWAINHRKESGAITSAPCAFCGKMNSEAHHPNYDEPLLIVWLCRECHRKIHPRPRTQPRSHGNGQENKWAEGVHLCVKNQYKRQGKLLESGKYKCGLCGKISPAKAEGRDEDEHAPIMEKSRQVVERIGR